MRTLSPGSGFPNKPHFQVEMTFSCRLTKPGKPGAVSKREVGRSPSLSLGSTVSGTPTTSTTPCPRLPFSELNILFAFLSPISLPFPSAF